MRSIFVSALVLGFLLPATARANNEVTATVTDQGDGCVYALAGKVPNFPNFTSLHVSVYVRGIQPTIEACFFRVAVQNGAFAANKRWPTQTFPPDVYTTCVTLHMDAQPPAVKAFLQREFGYTSDHVEVISTTDTAVGTPEEQLAHRKKTLVLLRGLTERLERLRASLAARTKPAAEDPEWAAFAEQLNADILALTEECDGVFESRVVWAQMYMFTELSGSLSELFVLVDQVGVRGEDALRRLGTMQERLSSMSSEIQSRMPREDAPDGRR